MGGGVHEFAWCVCLAIKIMRAVGNIPEKMHTYYVRAICTLQYDQLIDWFRSHPKNICWPLQMMDWGDVFPDLYDVLDIDEGAVDQEILRAFRIQVVRVHPDKLGPLASEDERTAAALRTRVILQAKNVLLNTESRKEYDSERRMRRQGEQQSKSGFSAPEEASAGMALVWEVWANVVVEGFAKQFEAGARGERVVQLLGTILMPAIGVGLGGERGFKLGLTLATVFNTGCISVVVKALSAEDQKLFFQTLEVLCTKMP